MKHEIISSINVNLTSDTCPALPKNYNNSSKINDTNATGSFEHHMLQLNEVS